MVGMDGTVRYAVYQMARNVLNLMILYVHWCTTGSMNRNSFIAHGIGRKFLRSIPDADALSPAP